MMFADPVQATAVKPQERTRKTQLGELLEKNTPLIKIFVVSHFLDFSGGGYLSQLMMNIESKLAMVVWNLASRTYDMM